ncbi:replication-relaxation family protein [Alkalihalobacillus macyae]|uniref:replication-relaxation family protein n=1 Tax=Guptibacillus hwajinpoensis TaxID=208199 RepID=UPI00273CA99C|nr:replication-relaxation family protein [Alkalihalobacillus macyae]MDP4549870.1 replication-relaxation family protein [Alkalihalobacillus macyae]
MNKRDTAILSDLQRHRVMSRDDIASLHFNNLKDPIKACNNVLKRMRRDGYIDAKLDHQPYLYFPYPSLIKKDSQKIPHFLAIVDFYKQATHLRKPKQFIVEPKYGKGYMEPDVFMVWNGSPFFVEIQRTFYSEKVMNEKISRYEAYYRSGLWKDETWQPLDKKVFPFIIIISDTRYSIDSNLKVFQAQSLNDFISSIGDRKSG